MNEIASDPIAFLRYYLLHTHVCAGETFEINGVTYVFDYAAGEWAVVPNTSRDINIDMSHVASIETNFEKKGSNNARITYNAFISEKIKEIKSESPDMDSKTRMRLAIEAWHAHRRQITV
jgi:hypothetical protein